MTQCAIDLALQGGGSHGAFTWGVLDRILEEPDIIIGGLSGTSAGAMNAVVLASGLATGGRDGARAALKAFWEDIGKKGARFPLRRTPLETLFGYWAPRHSPMLKLYDMVSRIFSPYQWNPMNLNPLRQAVVRHVDFGALATLEELKIFVCATNVHTGRHRVFRNADLSVDAVLASACLPVLFQAVKIGEESYWDGGYTANPALLPLIAESSPRDLVLVQINPLERPAVPYSAPDIIDRMNEISFNSSLDHELRTVALIKHLLKQERASGHAYHERLFRKIDDLFIHRIEAQKALDTFGASSKLNPEWGLVSRLHGIGRRAAEAWIGRHRQDVGRRSTIDLFAEYADYL